jgi:hypothetical protein
MPWRPMASGFLWSKTPEGAMPVTQINVVLNWMEELKRLAPTK